ncbi:protein argonaute PNH1-like [Rutidosis leptorrhynchoides]|uniref:protein argonaute PNH1-like n=1 Tax=Rutidosis leptorrhynchoides TaxID=125765 RepID=UPI003A998425
MSGCYGMIKKVTKMLKATCIPPKDLEKDTLYRYFNIFSPLSAIIVFFLNLVVKGAYRGNNFNADYLLQEFGLHVVENLTEIKARVLPPPYLKYRQRGIELEILPDVGEWNMNDLEMFNGGKVNYWAVVNFSGLSIDVVDCFCVGIILMRGAKGMTFTQEPLFPIVTETPNNIRNALTHIHRLSISKSGQEKSLQLLFVILADMSECYGLIKRVCETELGIVSQCRQQNALCR